MKETQDIIKPVGNSRPSMRKAALKNKNLDSK